MAKTKLKITKSLSNNTLISLIMAGCMVAVVISFLISKQLVGDIGFNNRVIARKNAVKATLEHNVAALPDLKSNFDILNQNGPKPSQVLSALPVDVAYGDLADQFEGMASLSGARLSAISLNSQTDVATGPVAGPAVPQPVQFQVTAVGSYVSLQKLMRSLEVSLRPIRIVSVKFNGSEPAVTAEFSLLTYYQNRTEVTPQMETIQ